MVEYSKILRHSFYELSPIGWISIQKKMRNREVNCTPPKTVTGRQALRWGQAALLPLPPTEMRMKRQESRKLSLQPHLMTTLNKPPGRNPELSDETMILPTVINNSASLHNYKVIGHNKQLRSAFPPLFSRV